jgi:hypothetical protein
MILTKIFTLLKNLLLKPLSRIKTSKNMYRFYRLAYKYPEVYRFMKLKTYYIRKMLKKPDPDAPRTKTMFLSRDYINDKYTKSRRFSGRKSVDWRYGDRTVYFINDLGRHHYGFKTSVSRYCEHRRLSKKS